jgi:hypothetical protein
MRLKKPDPNKPWVKFTRYLDGFRLWFNRRTEEDPLNTWPEDSRRDPQERTPLVR